MAHREIHKPIPADYRPSPIQTESFAVKAENARREHGTYKEQPFERLAPPPERVEAGEEFGETVRKFYERQEISMNRIDKEKATQMHADGASDRVIADEFGVTPVAVRSWREKNNLSANHASGGRQEGSGREVTVDYDRAVVLYERGWNDSEIAEDVGCDVRTIRDWRKKEGLESNFRKPEKGIVSCHICGAVYNFGTEHKCQIAEDPEPVIETAKTAPGITVESLKSFHPATEECKICGLSYPIGSKHDCKLLFKNNFDSDDPIVPSEEHQTEEQLIDKLLDTATVELNLANFISAIKKSFETSRCEIEEKNAIIQDLLVKNAELAGFIDGIKFVKGWLES